MRQRGLVPDVRARRRPAHWCAFRSARGVTNASAEAWIYQNGDHNSATLTQSGADNSAKLSQTGNSNTLDLTQQGGANTAVLEQLGIGLTLGITQFGGAVITITQTGP